MHELIAGLGHRPRWDGKASRSGPGAQRGPRWGWVLGGALLLGACSQETPPAAPAPAAVAAPARDYYGTLEPFASHAVYFVLTDRFVNGDEANDQRDQGGAHPTFDRKTPGLPEGLDDNIGYLGGDFRGLLDHADYIADMGFGAVWLTPVVDNPDEAFSGGDPAVYGSMMSDQGKTGYHGYWGVNFYQLDEHLPSPGLGFAELTAGLKAKGLKTVLDVVANHGSPSFTMPVDQPKYGEIYGADGKLLADHQNLPPEQLKPDENPLHRFYRPESDLVQLSNLDDRRPEVLDYFVGAYTQWLDQGADALRIDTIGHVPNPFWHDFAVRLRQHRPGLYLFGERYSFDPPVVAQHTWPENGAISVLDFPLKGAFGEVFEKGEGFEKIAEALFLQSGPYANPYDLAIFYDNHDMPRLKASDEGFIDAHNLLFTLRGIPVLYYGSETGFMRGAAEHAGNRNYYGSEGIAAAAGNPIHEHLKRIASVRRDSIALQRGLQLDLEFAGDRAAFYRVYQHDGVDQTALVLLNKADQPATFNIDAPVQAGSWRAALGGAALEFAPGAPFQAEIPAHGVEVYLYDAALTDPTLLTKLDDAMAHRLGVQQAPSTDQH
jgi:glycosidase